MDERGCVIAATILGLIAAMITIFVFLTGKQSLTEALASSPDTESASDPLTPSVGGRPETEVQAPQPWVGKIETQAAKRERFEKNSGETVLDTQTGLTWQLFDNGYIVNYNHAEAICSALIIGERADWSLPTVNDFRNLIGSFNLRRIPRPISVSSPVLWTRDVNGSREPIYLYHANGPIADKNWKGARALCVHR